MRIKEIRCEQFAGLHDREYEFNNGLNLIIGENESGKSTLVDLLYHLFFQDVKVGAKSASDKNFTELYFPKTVGKLNGDTIDGVLRFQTDEGNYKLSKEWAGKNGRVKLTLPDGTIIQSADKIQETLSEVLGYGKGVYDELVFASQRRPQSILRGLLGGKASENMDELAGTITKAVMETGGVDMDEMEKELQETVASYKGRWDFAADVPEGGKKRGLNNPWKQGAGRILNAYYNRERIAEAQNAAKLAEEKVEEINADIQSHKRKLEDLKGQRERFSSVRSLVEAQKANRQLLEAEKTNLGKMNAARDDWPLKNQELEKARALKEELRQASLKEKYDSVSKIIESRDKKQTSIDDIGDIDEGDVKTAERLTADILKLEAKLRGMNLCARIRQLGDTEILVKSAISGDALSLDGDMLTITEAVDICIPGVVEIQLSPKGIDTAAIQQELNDKRDQLREILKRYGVESAENLSVRLDELKEQRRNLDSLNSQIKNALGEQTWEALRSESAKLPLSLRTPAEIEKDIADLCKGSIDVFIGKVYSRIDEYEKEYGSKEKLSADREKQERTVSELQKKAASAEIIPEEFAHIGDPDKYGEKLKSSVGTEEEQLESLRQRLSTAERVLPEKSAEEYADDYEKAEADFERLKEEHAHWAHIMEIFQEVKNNSSKGSLLADVKRTFAEHLSVLSGGNIALNAIGEDLGSSISSGNSRLTADILSDGTKDTIALAFRLAVLEHLFPEGGCVAVFDDPFTDMDPKRTRQACALIQKFAENNQVLFVSCDEKYTQLLNGNVITVK